jgi:hypothetical protein
MKGYEAFSAERAGFLDTPRVSIRFNVKKVEGMFVAVT